MRDDNHTGWIVLIDRSPRGPLTQDEIRLLLKDGSVRINDVAFKVTPESPKGSSTWKFLWQFMEFDRRAQETPEQAEKQKERRQPSPSEEVVKKQVLERLPQELLSIAPEELVLRSKKTISDSHFAESGISDNIPMYLLGTAKRMHVAYGLMALVALSWVGWGIYSLNPTGIPSTEKQMEGSRRDPTHLSLPLIKEVSKKPEIRPVIVPRAPEPEAPAERPKEYLPVDPRDERDLREREEDEENARVEDPVFDRKPSGKSIRKVKRLNLNEENLDETEGKETDEQPEPLD